MLIAASVACAFAVAALSTAAIAYWRYPNFRDEGFPLVLFFDIVFAYRLYRYLKLIPPKNRPS